MAILRKALPAGHWQTAQAESLLGGCLAGLGRYEEAERLLVEGYATLRDKRGEADRETGLARARLIDLYDAWGKPDKAAVHRK